MMGNYKTSSHVTVSKFTRQNEGSEVIIGCLDTSIFLVLPCDAVEILDYLALGKTVGEAQSLYYQKYGELPDVQDLLQTLEQKGFVQPLVHETITQTKSIPNLYQEPHKVKTKSIRYHFAHFPQSLARKLFSRRIQLACCILIGFALLVTTFEPSIIPGWGAHFFKKNLTLMKLVLILMNYFMVFLHEMAHLIAARAVGVSSRLGISNRMWYLVAETDMTGMWAVPRHQRYFPFLAGVLLDATCAAVLILILFFHYHNWLFLHPILFQLSRAMLLSFLMGLLWQFYLFIRTDFYFVIANFFRCKSLMKDTEVYLCNQLARFYRSYRPVNQSYIPKSEMQVIRCYAVLWIVGRIAAICSLIFITIPLNWHYYLKVFDILSAGYQTNPYAFIDALLMAILVFVPQSLGFALWIRSFGNLQR